VTERREFMPDRPAVPLDPALRRAVGCGEARMTGEVAVVASVSSDLVPCRMSAA
jgi:hypothetical protein